MDNFLFIPLDIFKKNMHNKDIKTEQEAWLAFLCCDDPSDIFNIIDKFPQFREMYEDIFALCQNTERMMEILKLKEQIEYLKQKEGYDS